MPRVPIQKLNSLVGRNCGRRCYSFIAPSPQNNLCCSDVPDVPEGRRVRLFLETHMAHFYGCKVVSAPTPHCNDFPRPLLKLNTLLQARDVMAARSIQETTQTYIVATHSTLQFYILVPPHTFNTVRNKISRV